MKNEIIKMQSVYTLKLHNYSWKGVLEKKLL